MQKRPLNEKVVEQQQTVAVVVVVAV